MAAKASFEKVCVACQKTYYSENAYENHVQSQKHRLRVASLAKDGTSTEDGETVSVISSTISLGEPINEAAPSVIAVDPPKDAIDAEAEAEFSKVINGIKETKITEEPVSRRPTRPHHSAGEQRVEHPLSPEKSKVFPKPISTEDSTTKPDTTLIHCLFCNQASNSFNLNVAHMKMSHGLFIPEQDYLVDFEGLVRWLWQRINDEPYECLYCHKTRSTAEAVRDHMRDLGHCKIAFEEEVDMIEVGQFYDFRSTYSDDEDHDGKAETHEDEEMEDGWESDSDVASDDLENAIVLDITTDTKKLHPRPTTQDKEQATISDNELHLPSGRIAGHRSLKKYYRQNLHSHPSSSERIERQLLLEAAIERGEEDTTMTNNNSNEGAETRRGRSQQLISRANGGLGMLGVTDLKKKEVQAVEKRDTKRAQRAEKAYQWGVNKRGNSQKHFRDPLLQ